MKFASLLHHQQQDNNQLFTRYSTKLLNLQNHDVVSQKVP